MGIARVNDNIDNGIAFIKCALSRDILLLYILDLPNDPDISKGNINS